MDIDGSSMGGDIDQNLLLQFSCMNTTDREELISQMQRLLGPSVNYYTASFFLDMSNWNLQAAICCYLDFSVPKLPMMTLTAAPSLVQTVGLNSSFEETFTLINTGTDPWPANCSVVQSYGEPLNALRYYLPQLAPGHTINVNLKLKAPSEPGNYLAHFHLVTADKMEQFGDVMKVAVRVESEMTMALVEQLAALPVPSSRMEDSVTQTQTQDDVSL